MAEKRILLVDDDANLREMLGMFLTKRGYTVLQARGGAQAIEMAEREKFGLMLLDLKMPDINGIEVLMTLKRKGIKTRVVVLTAVDSVELEKEARMNGAAGFLRKQLEPPVIADAIDAIFKDMEEKSGAKPKEESGKVMIVDDNRDIRELLEKFLTKKGYSTLTAASGEEALEKLKSEKSVIVLLDVALPGMDGLAVLKNIRQRNLGAGVIMITGIKDERIADQAIKEGAFDYIVKPFDLDYLEMCLVTKMLLASA